MKASKVTILFSTPLKFNIGSWVIKSRLLGIGLPFSHVTLELLFDEKKKTYLIFECSDFGVRLINRRKFYRENKIIRSFDFSLNQYRHEEIKDFIFKNLGHNYSVKGVLSHATTNLFKKPIPYLKSGDKFNCCEVIFLCLKEELASYFNDFYQEYPHQIPPDILYKALLKMQRDHERERNKESAIAKRLRRELDSMQKISPQWEERIPLLRSENNPSPFESLQ